MDQTWWADLVPDVLRDIAGRLRYPGDLIRFHAVCRPWRDSREATTRTKTRPAPASSSDASSPSPSYRAPLVPPSVQRRNWVCSAVGTAVRYLTVEHLRPSLHDPLSGEVTHLPMFLDGQWEGENPHGILYGDGTTLLYTISLTTTARFRAMLLHPGDAEWTMVERVFGIPWHGSFCAAYHDGKILVTTGGSIWRIIKLNTPDITDDVFVQKKWIRWGDDGGDHRDHFNYVLESHGEILWASVWVHVCSSSPQLRVLVYALEEEARWVKRDGHSLKDRVFFLGSPNSFAMDATVLGRNGGYVYFVYCDSKALRPHDRYGVFRYNLLNEYWTKLRYIDDEAKLVERLPQRWVQRA